VDSNLIIINIYL